MNIAVIHGYVLQGTGSNLYVQNLCREFCRACHTVSLFCQESEPEQIDFVSKAVDFDADNKKQKIHFIRETEYTGECILYRPNIAKLLPVYVYDRYEGYEVKEYTDMTQAEIESYLSNNSQALQSVFSEKSPNLIVSNHTIMQPVYAARANKSTSNAQHFMVVHGSSLNFSVRKSELLKEYANEAVNGTDKIIFVSSHSRKEFLEFFSNSSKIVDKATVIPAGVDIDKFVPLRSNDEKNKRIGQLVKTLKPMIQGGNGRTGQDKIVFSQAISTIESNRDIRPLINSVNQNINNWTPDLDVLERIEQIDLKNEYLALFWGKYLWTKGIHLIIAAAPMILEKHPNTRFIIVGFGSFRGYLEALVAALEHNKRDLFIELLSNPELYDDEIDQNSTVHIAGLLEKLKVKTFADQYFGSVNEIASERIIFTGYMSHDCLKDLIPCSDIPIAPSIFPEAFGMVAIEALASGIIPLSANHSGFADVINVFTEDFNNLIDTKWIKSLNLDEQLVLNIADTACKLLDYYKELDDEDRQIIRRKAHNVCRNNYSWGAVATSFVAFPELVSRHL